MKPVTTCTHQSVVSFVGEEPPVAEERAVLAVVGGKLAHREERVHDHERRDAATTTETMMG
jgi:hypothetical protein